jgi:DNA-directed RNA polymerase specialized sigma24 family protein
VSKPRAKSRLLSDAELYAAGDEELLRHIAASKQADDLDAARTAMHMLLYKHERRIRRRVGLRLPEHLAHHEDTVAAWVLARVMESALKLGLEGESVGEWVRWYGTAVDRQVISFFRSAQGQALEREATLVAGDGEDGMPPEQPAADFDPNLAVAQLCHAGLVQDVLDRMENPMHVAVVRAAFWDDLPSAQIAAANGTSAANVDQIKSRFKRELRAECERRGVTGA